MPVAPGCASFWSGRSSDARSSGVLHPASMNQLVCHCNEQLQHDEQPKSLPTCSVPERSMGQPALASCSNLADTDEFPGPVLSWAAVCVSTLVSSVVTAHAAALLTVSWVAAARFHDPSFGFPGTHLAVCPAALYVSKCGPLLVLSNLTAWSREQHSCEDQADQVDVSTPLTYARHYRHDKL